MALILRDYQDDTIQKIISGFQEGIQRQLIVLATGLGKLLITVKLHERFNSNYKTLFIADRIELVYQAYYRFKAEFPELRVGIEMGENFSHENDDIIIASVQTIGRNLSGRIHSLDLDKIRLVILDEAHVTTSPMYQRVLNYLGVGNNNLLPNKYLLGATATPNRTDKIGLSINFDDIAVNYDLGYGINSGWLTDISLFQVKTKTDLREIPFYNGEFSKQELGSALDTPERNELIVKTYKELSFNETCIIFAGSVEHAYNLSQTFKDNGITSECIEAQTNKNDRKKWIQMLNENRIKVIANYGVLTTGVDIPEIANIYICRPIGSDLLLRQIIGRGLRPSYTAFVDFFFTSDSRKEAISNSCKPICKVVDFHDMVGDHRLASIPSLFGINKDFKIKAGQRIFKEVVEPLEFIKHTKNVDISKIDSFEHLDAIIARLSVKIESIQTPHSLLELTDRNWIETSDGYEIRYPKENKNLIVKSNSLDMYDLIEYNTKEKKYNKLQSFKSLTGAINIADQYADQMYDTTFSKRKSEESSIITKSQVSFLKRLLKGGIYQDYTKRHSNGMPYTYYRGKKDYILLDSNSAANLISTILEKKQLGKIIYDSRVKK